MGECRWCYQVMEDWDRDFPPMTALRPAIFLDRDGTLNKAIVREGKPYPPSTPEEFVLLPGVLEGCARLKQAGFLLVVATNQPDVGRGTQKQEIVEAIHARMLKQLSIDRIEVCYHAGRGEPCDCRKPAPGMLMRAAEALAINLSKSWMIGDRWRDIDCGQAAGCRTIFIDQGYDEKLRAIPDFTACDFLQATAIVLNNSPRSHPP